MPVTTTQRWHYNIQHAPTGRKQSRGHETKHHTSYKVAEMNITWAEKEQHDDKDRERRRELTMEDEQN